MKKSINLNSKFDKFRDYWSPKVIAEMNDYQFKLVKIKGEFVKHQHSDSMDLKTFEVYKKFLLFLGVIFLFFASTSFVWSKSEIDLIEIKLINNLDDKRGFCIDIKGHKSRAKIDRGLQAHTCYSYQGEIAIDQGLDADRLKQKELFFPNFDVCVYPSSYNNPLSLTLIKCKNTQEFILDEDNTIRLKHNTNLCLTVGSEYSRKGGGGTPVHLIRDLFIKNCNQELSKYQSWGIRRIVKGKIFSKQMSKFLFNKN